jgi:hypothetical protein
MENYRVYYPAEDGYPAATMDCTVLASLEKEDGGRLFLAKCGSPAEAAAKMFQYKLLYARPVEAGDSALAMARFSGEKAAIRNADFFLKCEFYGEKTS